MLQESAFLLIPRRDITFSGTKLEITLRSTALSCDINAQTPSVSMWQQIFFGILPNYVQKLM